MKDGSIAGLDDMGLLERCLQTCKLNEFRESYLGRQPLAGAGSAAFAAHSCGWEALDSLLQGEPPDVLVVARGRSLTRVPPRSLSELRTLFRRGIGIAVRTADQTSAPVAALSQQFALDLPGLQRVIVFATPAGTHGFGWHYDAEDVFIVQTAGDKEYYFRRNTVAPPPPSTPDAFHPDFNVYARETSPLQSCRLIAGDWLYLPRGFWHAAIAHEDALSVSIGVFPQPQPQPQPDCQNSRV